MTISSFRSVPGISATVSGLVVVGLGEGVLMGVAYFVTGLPHVALLAFITAIAAMLPFCAPLTFGLAALWLFSQGSVAGAIGLAVFGSVVVFVAEHFVRPVLIVLTLPLTLVTNSVRVPWLGLGHATGTLAEVIALSVAACVVAARRAAL